jgi:hypothetical protein
METLVDFCKLSGPHSGENLAEAFIDSCKEMGILTKVSNTVFKREKEHIANINLYPIDPCMHNR